VIEHPENRGKGAAVRSGMLAARGARLLFADADGATPISQQAKLADVLIKTAGADVAVGSRLVRDGDVTRRRTPLRGLAGRLFATIARWWLHIPVRDTQCGFKMFRREAGRELFYLGRETGYLFDLELLGLAQLLGLHVVEVPIDWADVPGGHLHPSREIGRILLGLWRIRRRLGELRRGMRDEG
jgi:dolichyl-phosphate beta-glucosyltransferase